LGKLILRVRLSDGYLDAIFKLERQNLHQILENFSATVSIIYPVHLVSTDNETHNLESYPFFFDFEDT
jgi:hypothetical protein